MVDPLEHRLPLLERMYKEYPAGKAPEVLERLAEIIRRAAAYLADRTEKSTDRFLAKFEWYARTLKTAREQGKPY